MISQKFDEHEMPHVMEFLIFFRTYMKSRSFMRILYELNGMACSFLRHVNDREKHCAFGANPGTCV